jgi:Flp pilus assembly protein CpaB
MNDSSRQAALRRWVKNPWLVAAGLVGTIVLVAMQIAMSIKTREGVDVEIKETPAEKLEIARSNVTGSDVSGKRAVRIRTVIDATAPDAGYLVPHSHVDVTADVSGTAGTICRNLLVLAVDTGNIRDDKPYSWVTVEATAEEAEKLTLAQSQGLLRLVLIKERSPEKAKNSSKTGEHEKGQVRLFNETQPDSFCFLRLWDVSKVKERWAK